MLFPDEDKIRREVRATAAQAIPAEHVDEVVDLAFHAASEAMNRLFSAGEVASNFRVAKAAVTIGFGLLRHSCEVYEQAAEMAALKHGDVVHQAKVRVDFQ